MSQLALIEKAIETSSLNFDGLGRLPDNHLELILAFSFKHDNLQVFEKTLKIINFSNTSIKNKNNTLNWLISHNLNNEKDFNKILEKKTTQYALHKGLKFDLCIITKKLKNVNLYQTFNYCDNISVNDFNSIFVSPIIQGEYQLLYKRIYDTLDYHQKYNKEIPLKFFENLCKIIIPNCIIANIKYPKNKDLQECQNAIQEFIDYFSDRFDFFALIPKNIFIDMTKTYFTGLNPLECEKYYNTMRENLLNKKITKIDDNKKTYKSKKI